MDIESINQAWNEIRETYSSFMQNLESNSEYKCLLYDLSSEPSTSDSIGEINSNTNNRLAILAPMIQQILQQQLMINQMFVEQLRQRKEIINYENDHFRPLDFSNMEGYPHGLQSDLWEEHASKFDDKQDPSEFMKTNSWRCLLFP